MVVDWSYALTPAACRQRTCIWCRAVRSHYNNRGNYSQIYLIWTISALQISQPVSQFPDCCAIHKAIYDAFIAIPVKVSHLTIFAKQNNIKPDN